MAAVALVAAPTIQSKHAPFRQSNEVVHLSNLPPLCKQTTKKSKHATKASKHIPQEKGKPTPQNVKKYGAPVVLVWPLVDGAVGRTRDIWSKCSIGACSRLSVPLVILICGSDIDSVQVCGLMYFVFKVRAGFVVKKRKKRRKKCWGLQLLLQIGRHTPGIENKRERPAHSPHLSLHVLLC